MKRLHESTNTLCLRCGEDDCTGCCAKRKLILNHGDTIIMEHNKHKIAVRICERIDYGVYRVRILHKPHKPVMHFLRVVNGEWEWLLCHETGEQAKDLYYRNWFKCLRGRVEILRVQSENGGAKTHLGAISS